MMQPGEGPRGEDELKRLDEEKARLRQNGPVEELRENRNVKEFYLGVGAERRRSFRDVKFYRRKKRWFSS